MKDRIKMVKNANGGINDMEKPALERARKADLITLPKDIRGTNCFNCRFIRDPLRGGHGFCKHPAVSQFVNERMCCALWDAFGTYRPYKKYI